MDPAVEKYNATVIDLEFLNPDLIVMKVKPDKPVAPFISGQYVLLGVSSNTPRRSGSDPEFKEQKPDRLVLRAYSIASGGHETDVIEFYISIVANGSLTPRLTTLKIGARLHFGDKIRGYFTLDTVPPDHEWVVLAATGTGLAPYVSMMRAHMLNPRPFRFVILHGGAHGWELGYMKELSLYAKFLPNVTYIPSITRIKEDIWWTGESGRITKYFETPELKDRFGLEFNPAKTSVFLCGNPAMIEQVGKILEPKGYTVHKPDAPGSLHTEEYW